MFVLTAAVSFHDIIVGKTWKMGNLNMIRGKSRQMGQVRENVLLAVVCVCSLHQVRNELMSKLSEAALMTSALELQIKRCVLVKHKPRFIKCLN